MPSPAPSARSSATRTARWPAEPGVVPPDGAGLGLDRAFSADDDDTDIAAFLADAGFVHLEGWVDPDLLPAIEDEVFTAAASVGRDEPHNLWATLADGTERC